MKISKKELPEDMIVLLEDFCETEDLPLEFNLVEINILALDNILLDDDRGEEHALEMNTKSIPPLIIARGYLMDGRHRVFKLKKEKKSSFYAIDISSLVTDEMFVANRLVKL